MAAPVGEKLPFSLAQALQRLSTGPGGWDNENAEMRSTAPGRARAYHRWQLLLMLAGLLLTAAYLVAAIASGAGVALRDLVQAVAPRWWLQLALAVLALGGGHALLAFPLDVVRSFWLPRRFGLLHEPFRRWLWDGAKARLIGALLAFAG